MSVNRRKNKYKSDKDFEKEQSADGFVSKTQLKNQAQDLKKFGLELTKLRASVLANLPVGEVTLKSLLDLQKMTTNLARKRHLMFIGKCLRNESETEIREYLNNIERVSVSTMQQKTTEAKEEVSEIGSDSSKTKKAKKADDVEQFIVALTKAEGEKVECLLESNIKLERQTLRQYIRNCNSAKDEKKKQLAKSKLLGYLKLNGVTDFS
ncbi:MAG: ribosomal 50S subunit-associated protein YjgA (DUF615 family) [Polaribacter sp.]|jgi:ribosomal 50S subunit-associated protein YjgA (DUF615 family)